MSSTQQPKREGPDFYPTPTWCTEALLSDWSIPDSNNDLLLDPCCGKGAILEIARASGFRTAGIEIQAVLAEQVSPDAKMVTVADALTIDWPECDLVVTNPPFNSAMRFVAKAVEHLRVGKCGRVAMLLRQAFISSKARQAFHLANPSRFLPLSRRPSFTGKGTDSCDYAWFVWGDRPGTWRLLPGHPQKAVLL